MSATRALLAAALGLLPPAPAAARNNLALTPPMGFMTWQLFRCNGPGANGPDDDCSDPATTYCISDALVRGQAAAMHARGFVAAGYDTASIDDCWMAGRNATTRQFEAYRQGARAGVVGAARAAPSSPLPTAPSFPRPAAQASRRARSRRPRRPCTRSG